MKWLGANVRAIPQSMQGDLEKLPLSTLRGSVSELAICELYPALKSGLYTSRVSGALDVRRDQSAEVHLGLIVGLEHS